MLIKSLEKWPGLRSEEGDPRAAAGGGGCLKFVQTREVVLETETQT